MRKVERIIILEDDVAFARSLSEILRDIAEVRFTSYPERLPQLISDFSPTLIIADYNLNHPTLDGVKVTRLIRQTPDTNLLPVLLLSGEDDMQVIEEAYKSGIDDYVLKPVSPRFLLAKIENLLFQSRKKLNAQALSGLPGNAAIETEFYLRLARRKPFSVAYSDLDNFKPFNDEKGVKKGDDAIQLAARLLYDLRAKNSRSELFVGHLGGDDFFLLGNAGTIRSTIVRLHRDFGKKSREFFSSAEAASGFYRGSDRQGNLCSFPLLTISSAILDGITVDRVPDFLSLTTLAARVKKIAKNSRTRVHDFNVRELPAVDSAKTLFTSEEAGAKKIQRVRKQK